MTALARAGSGAIFATTLVGVYRSLDAGQTWTLPGRSSSVAFGEALVASDASLFAGAPDGLHRSTDGGQTWHQVLTGTRVLCAAATTEPRLVIVGTQTDGVLRSTDEGRNWSGANAGLLDLCVLALGLSHDFRVDGLGFVGTTAGLYRTRNAAQSWRSVDLGCDAAIQCVAVSPSVERNRLVVAGTEADGLLCSHDAGTTWQSSPALAGRSVTAVAFLRSGTLVAATDAGIGVSEDQATTWEFVAPDVTSVLTLLAADDGVLLAGLDGRGIARSLDKGRTWTPADTGLEASLLSHLVFSPEHGSDGTLLVGGPDAGVRLSCDAGLTWCDASAGLDDRGAYGLCTTAGRSVLAATADGLFCCDVPGAQWRLSWSDAGVTARTVASAGARVCAALETGELLASDDAGHTWRRLGTPFQGATVLALALGDDITFVAATSSSETVIWRSADCGANWQRWLVEAGQHASIALAISPNYRIDDRVFVGLANTVLAPSRRAAEVRRGERRPLWQRSHLPPEARIIATAVSPSFATDRRLFVATSAGVYVSRDAGETFAAWRDGMDQRPVLALAIAPTRVFALQLGGRVWRRGATETDSP